MYCPNCGKADQAPDTYCRRCGSFLPDFEKAKKKTTPEEHIKANAALSLLTVIASLTLSVLLFLIFKNYPDPHPIIYVTAGFLITIAAWQIQTFWRTMLLRKHFTQPKNRTDSQSVPPSFEIQPTNPLLSEADFENHVPASVVERTTRKLKAEKKREGFEN